MTHETECLFCQAPVTLEVIDTPHPIRAWRMFECPFCLRTNVLTLFGQILTVLHGHHSPGVRTAVPPRVAETASH